MGESKLLNNKSGFLRKFLWKPPGVPTKPERIKVDTLPPLEIMPNYIRRAMGIRGRRVILSSEAQIMLRTAAWCRDVYSGRYADSMSAALLGSLRPHQVEVMERLRGVNDQVTILPVPEGVGK